MGLIGLHFKICYINGTEKKEQHDISVLVLVKGKCPGTYTVTHDIHFQLKYHIHNHNYSYYISMGVLNCDARYDQDAQSNKAQTLPSPHYHTEVYY